MIESRERVLSGLVIPWGMAGNMTVGGRTARVKFSRESLSWPDDPSRLKLLVEHDTAGEVVGHALAIHRGTDGLRCVFAVYGQHTAILSASTRLRDGLSPGVEFDQATLQRLRRANRSSAVDAGGVLREVSLVAVPAFWTAFGTVELP